MASARRNGIRSAHSLWTRPDPREHPLSGFASLPPGDYALTVDGTSPDRTRSTEVTVAIEVDCHPDPAFSVGGIVLGVGMLAGVGLLAL